MNIIERHISKNDCYKNNVNRVDSRYTTFQQRGPQGLVLHSVGCAQPSALVFANAWNVPNKEVAVHAVLQADGTVYQCMPWNFRGWHAGGTANNTHVGVEMTEPASLKYGNGGKFTCSDPNGAKAFVKQTFDTAVLLFAKLCREYGLDPTRDGVIISHTEGNKRGIASAHGDPEHLWKGLGMDLTMDKFRAAVKAEIDRQIAEETAANRPPDEITPVEEPAPVVDPEPAEQPKLDNTPAKWAKAAVEWGQKNGLMVGDNHGNLMLRSPITREQFIVVLYRYDEYRRKN